MTFLREAANRILILDGATGTALSAMALPERAFDGRPGCYEILNLTAPDAVRSVHNAYFDAGCDIVETNTFGANPVVLAEYDLAPRTSEINEAAARIARKAAGDASVRDGRPRFVAGSIGPGTKLPSLGQIGFDALREGYRLQIDGLLEGGADLLLVETVQDLLQAKAAVAAAREAMEGRPRVPIYVSVTVEATGTLLTGSDIQAVVAALAPMGIDLLGLNCALGPVGMRPHLEILAREFPGLIGLYPNAGLPVATAQGVRYPESPAEFARTLGIFARELPLSVLGGCCGTTPDHIRSLASALTGASPKAGAGKRTPALASLFGAVPLRQIPPPLFIGERANATGSRAFKDALLSGRDEAALAILSAQEESGSHAADLSVAFTGRDEIGDMTRLVEKGVRESRLPLVIDSTRPEVVEAALKRIGGRALVNSINLEDGGAKARSVLDLARRFGAAVIALTIDETGMALTAERKLSVARRLHDLAVGEFGLKPEDLLIDPLTFTLGSGDATLRRAAEETLQAIRLIHRELPGVGCVLGLSNVSFGLSPRSRRVLNSVFLHEALAAGLDAAILNPAQILPLNDIPGADREAARALLHPGDREDALDAFIRHFEGRGEDPEATGTPVSRTPEEILFQGVVKGRIVEAEEAIPRLLEHQTAESVLNGILVPAMREVGDLFGRGVLQLPFVLKSAETMKRAVDRLRPHFARQETDARRPTLLIATVKGDVHDIGKNLVGIILENNGFRVIDLGTKVPVETIIEQARVHAPDAIGMSGLLVSSALTMGDNLHAMALAGLNGPVLVGGAALSAGFVKESLAPLYPDGRVIYCADAFAGLTAMQSVAKGELPDEAEPAARRLTRDSWGSEPIRIETVPAPTPPFRGVRELPPPPLDALYDLLNETALFRGRWGYRRGEMEAAAYRRLIEEEVRPRFKALWRLVKAEGLFRPRALYGWFEARSEGDDLLLVHEGSTRRLSFPRRATAPTLSIPDFFRPDSDVAGLFIVTLGEEVERKGKALLGASDYLDYHLLHGLAVETADALAEYLHDRMREELGFPDAPPLSLADRVTQRYRGSRYGFGYPACPDLRAHETVFELLQPERIGLRLSENWQIVPEFSTTALVAHHPQAKYFAV